VGDARFTPIHRSALVRLKGSSEDDAGMGNRRKGRANCRQISIFITYCLRLSARPTESAGKAGRISRGFTVPFRRRRFRVRLFPQNDFVHRSLRAAIALARLISHGFQDAKIEARERMRQGGGRWGGWNGTEDRRGSKNGTEKPADVRPVLSSESASSLYRDNQIARHKFRLCAVTPRKSDRSEIE